MSTESVSLFQSVLKSLTEGDAPFMTLFFIIMVFVIYMAIKILKYFSTSSDNHNTQLTAMSINMAQQREEHYKMVAEERIRSDIREKELFTNLQKNTEQLEGIATTLKEVQFNFSSLENKVEQNFQYLETEIDSLKDKIGNDRG